MEQQLSPFHVGLIIDGNRRGGGHEAGYLALKELLPQVWNYEVTHLTCFALSIDNLDKRGEEAILIKNLICRGIKEICDSPWFKEKQAKLLVVGAWRYNQYGENHFWLSLDGLVESTKNNTGPIFAVAFMYDGKEEIVEMTERIRMEMPWPHFPLHLARADIQKRLWSSELPDVDLLIRTGEEEPQWTHLSGYFLPWQLGYTQLYSSPVFWPQFTIKEFEKAVVEYRARRRRRGA